MPGGPGATPTDCGGPHHVRGVLHQQRRGAQPLGARHGHTDAHFGLHVEHGHVGAHPGHTDTSLADHLGAHPGHTDTANQL